MRRGSQLGLACLAITMMLVPLALALSPTFEDGHFAASIATPLWLLGAGLWCITVLPYWDRHTGGQSMSAGAVVLAGAMCLLILPMAHVPINREEASGSFFLLSFSLLFFSGLILVVLGAAKNLLVVIRRKRTPHTSV